MAGFGSSLLFTTGTFCPIEGRYRDDRCAGCDKSCEPFAYELSFGRVNTDRRTVELLIRMLSGG